jgi:hypothetical protein
MVPGQKPTPPGLRYDAFVSIPMAAVETEEDYTKIREMALAVIDIL